MPGLSVLFWNVNRKPLAARVARLAAAHAVDVVAVAECPFAAGEFEAASRAAFRLPSFGATDLRVWVRAGIRVQTRLDAPRWQVYRVWVGPKSDVVLVFTHLVSKLHREPADQFHAVRRLVRAVEDEEAERKHRRTVVAGDLNMNPFDPAVAGAGGLHATMCGRTAGRGVRTVNGETHRFFYNPMWGLLGDRTPGPPGSYYTGPAGVVSYFWETFDQVLVRPELIASLAHVAILDHDGTASLLTRNGLPDRKNGSDHLPLLFRLVR